MYRLVFINVCFLSRQARLPGMDVKAHLVPWSLKQGCITTFFREDRDPARRATVQVGVAVIVGIIPFDPYTSREEADRRDLAKLQVLEYL